MPSIKEYNVKLNSLKNTRKMTSTMKLVAASKLRRAQDAQRNGAAYSERLNNMISRLAGVVETGDHPLLEVRPVVKNVLLLMFTSDKGLCGGFNNSIIKQVVRWSREQEGKELSMSFCGRRGFQYFKSRAEVCREYEGVTNRPKFQDADMIAGDLCEAFISGEVDEVYITYNHFISPLSQKPTMSRLLPIQPEEVKGEEQEFNAPYIFEPDQATLLDSLLPKTVSFKIFYALLENAAGEHGARMTAMDSASSNADKLIDDYTLLRNRARQAAITTELTEIVSGAEAQ